MVNESHKQQFSLWFTLRKSIALMRECDPYYIYAWIAQLLEESVFLYYFIWATSQIIDMVVSKTISHISDTRLLSLVIPMLIIGMLDRVVKYQFVLDDSDFNNKFPLFVET